MSSGDVFGDASNLAAGAGLLVSCLYAASYVYNVGFLNQLKINLSDVPFTVSDLSRGVLIWLFPWMLACCCYLMYFSLVHGLIVHHPLAASGLVILAAFVFSMHGDISRISHFYVFLLIIFTAVFLLIKGLGGGDQGVFHVILVKLTQHVFHATPQIGNVLIVFAYILIPFITAYDYGIMHAYDTLAVQKTISMNIGEAGQDEEVRILKHYELGILYYSIKDREIHFLTSDGKSRLSLSCGQRFKGGWLGKIFRSQGPRNI